MRTQLWREAIKKLVDLFMLFLEHGILQVPAKKVLSSRAKNRRKNPKSIKRNLFRFSGSITLDCRLGNPC